ncbi:tetratricopeptide repeat protein [Rathayibacter sp. CAU 1779]
MSVQSALALAQTWLNSDRPDRALEALADEVRKAPDDPRLMAMAGRAHGQLGNREEAVECVERAVALDPSDEFIWRSAADVYGDAGDLERARAAASRAVELAPDNPFAHMSHAVALLRRPGQPQRATAAAREAVRLAPTEPGAHFVLGNALLDSGYLTGAENEYRTVLSLAPGHPGAIHNLGVAGLRGGQEGRALAAFSGTLSLDPTITLARENLMRSVLVSLNRLSVAGWIVAVGGLALWAFTLRPPGMPTPARGATVAFVVVLLATIYALNSFPGHGVHDLVVGYRFAFGRSRALRTSAILVVVSYAIIVCAAFLSGMLPEVFFVGFMLVQYVTRRSLRQARREVVAPSPYT